jgi:RNA polymerase sigma-70 factor (sigma-E family)
VGSDEPDGDAEFRAFVIARRDTLWRVALLITADRGRAEDLVQTAFLRTFARWDRLRHEDPFSYARRIVVNANVDWWRRDRGREIITADPPDTIGPDLAAGVAQRDALLRALASLPQSERRVIVLRFLIDLSEANTAAELGLPLGTVKSVTHRAIGRLRASGLAADMNEVTP